MLSKTQTRPHLCRRLLIKMSSISLILLNVRKYEQEYKTLWKKTSCKKKNKRTLIFIYLFIHISENINTKLYSMSSFHWKTSVLGIKKTFSMGNCWSYPGLYQCCILTFDLAKHAIPKWCTGRKWRIPMASNRKKLRRWIWLAKWDKVKAHDTLIDWCTGRVWPLNCMTVISAWWRSNMPFQRLSGQLNYSITRWPQEVSELEIRWVIDKMW